MANYNGKIRTNYFRIKSEKAFMEAVSHLSGECEIETSVETKDGKLYGWFGSYGYIDYCDDCVDEEDDVSSADELFVKKMQEVIADDDAMVITEVGNEKLRYLVGFCTIITSKEVKYVNLENTSINLAREMLGNPEWETRNSY